MAVGVRKGTNKSSSRLNTKGIKRIKQPTQYPDSKQLRMYDILNKFKLILQVSSVACFRCFIGQLGAARNTVREKMAPVEKSFSDNERAGQKEKNQGFLFCLSFLSVFSQYTFFTQVLKFAYVRTFEGSEQISRNSIRQHPRINLILYLIMAGVTHYKFRRP